MSRAGVLRAGAALVASATGVAALAGRATAATVPDADLTYLRLLVAAELLKADFESQALTSRKLAPAATALVRRMRADDRAHYDRLATLLAGAGQSPATAGDIDFAYPRGSFGSQASIAKLAWKLTTLSLGGYLGAVENVQTPQLRLPLGQIAANEAQQLSALSQLLRRPMIGGAFAPALQIDAVSAALDAYES
jgi:hypothetical protein